MKIALLLISAALSILHPFECLGSELTSLSSGKNGNCSRARREHSFWRGFDVAELRCWKQWRGKIASEVG
jgi:hypothetical protein